MESHQILEIIGSALLASSGLVALVASLVGWTDVQKIQDSLVKTQDLDAPAAGRRAKKSSDTRRMVYGILMAVFLVGGIALTVTGQVLESTAPSAGA